MRIQLLCTFMMVAACSTAPKGTDQRRDLQNSADATLQTMMSRDPGLRGVLADSAGYAVFPEVGKGGLIVGAARGQGILYENGRSIGYVSLTQGSIGAQAGAQTFAELVVFRTPTELQRLKAGQYSVGANASAVILTAGASAGADFRSGVAVFTMPRGGAMAELSVSGQKINFQPRG
jgi:lipid-binding SYLF domain-containing protein